VPNSGTWRRALIAIAVVPLLFASSSGCTEDGPDDGCGADTCPGTPDSEALDTPRPPLTYADEPFQCDIELTRLEFDVSVNTGKAVIILSPSCDGRVSLAVSGLTDVVANHAPPHAGGADFQFRVVDGRLDVASYRDQVAVTWRFQRRSGFDGMREEGSSVLWPEHCDNLFPCHPSMTTGSAYTIAVAGVPKGQIAVFPPKLEADAPAYMPALAVGDYTYVKVGTTKAGTEVGYWTLPSTAEAAKSGLSQLAETFEWLETTLGTFSYGNKVGGVAVDWGLQYGGLENHPYWHVSKLAMGDLKIHTHEATHGWFGAGVRLACWNDLVMSEGTADYLTAEAIEAVQGKDAAAKMWQAYQSHYDKKVAGGADMVLWPDGCGDVKSANLLLRQLLYKKGALFWREVGKHVGKDALHAAMASYYKDNVNKAGKLADLLARIEKDTGKSLAALTKLWLKSKK
jgi:hypothetical protein